MNSPRHLLYYQSNYLLHTGFKKAHRIEVGSRVFGNTFAKNNILQTSACELPVAYWALTAANSYVRVFHVERKCDR